MKIKMKDTILEHYQKVHELEVEGITVRVWKPRTMQQLPAYFMLEWIKDWAREVAHYCHREQKNDWYLGNPDYGLWDAQVVYHTDPRHKSFDIYVAAIIVRPYSREAYDFYCSRHTEIWDINQRLMLMFDSREYDRIHGYDSSYGKPKNWNERKDTLYVVEDEERDLADESPDWYRETQENHGIVFKFKYDDGCYKNETTWPMPAEGESQVPEKFLELNTAAVKCFGHIHEEHPEIVEAHFYTEANEWEIDDEDDSEKDVVEE